MKNITLVCLTLFSFAFSCEDDSPMSQPCIEGRIVGQKCDIYALQLTQTTLGAKEWTKKNSATGEIEGTYSNVIGLINLPQEFRADDQVVFVTLREPTKEERAISCYTDMPGPPSPFYVVVSASETKCDNATQ